MKVDGNLMTMSLTDVQVQAGALAGECRGGPAQKSFGDPESEYAAARSSAALFDLSDRTQIELTGGDRAKFLHNFCTNDIRGLKPGQGCEAFVCNVQGKTLGHIFAFAAPESLLIDTVPGANSNLLKHIQKYHITEDVGFFDRTAEWGTLFLTGPSAPAVLSSLQLPGEELPPLAHVAADWNGTKLFIRRTDWLQLPGWEVVVPRDKLADVWTALKDNGAKPAGSDAWESLRLEACVPVYGVDITVDNLAPEAGRNSRTISYTKGCYLGQEPIARIDALGHVNRELRGIRFEPGNVPAAGTELVITGDTERVVGQVTSAAHSFQTGAPVALGYLKRQHDKPGQVVRASIGTETLPGIVFTADSDRK